MKDIIGYEGLYAIEEDGRIWNCKYKKYLSGYYGNDGYKRMCLRKNANKEYFLLHRLIALAYIPNPDNKPYIDHIDRVRNNNSINNLRWVTKMENNQNMSLYNTNTTGEKNISVDKRRNHFRVTIERNKTIYSKRFKTLQEAIECRDNYLEPFASSLEDA